MKGISFRKLVVLGLFAASAVAPTAALAQSNWGIFYFNDGNGTCGYISCGANGCAVIDMFPCPREVSGD